ncbi:hypothetical protein JKG47_22610, partial [Acidithiobacillus sp. MC6.1]|nr:hypothetical protein [Acidithiobacillus sp. MC6.1]
KSNINIKNNINLTYLASKIEELISKPLVLRRSMRIKAIKSNTVEYLLKDDSNAKINKEEIVKLKEELAKIKA